MLADSSWRPFKEAFAVPLRNGLTRPKKVRGAGVKMVNMGELFRNPRISDIPMDRVPLSREEYTYLLEPRDLLFARQSLVYEGAGQCSIFLGASEPVTFESHLIRARLDPLVADADFYFYFFSSPLGRKVIGQIIEQVSAAGVRGSDLAKLRLPFPSLERQRQLAHILSTLDDKIELNRQMNQTLEAIARAIFKSWFVDFDPVRAKMEGRQPAGMDAETADLFPDSLEETERGSVPAGWRITELPRAIDVNPRRTLPKGAVAPYLAMSDMPTSSALPQSWAVREFGSGTRFVNGDTLLARITPCLENGKTAFVTFLAEGEVGWGSTEYIVLRTKLPLPLSYSYFLARTNQFRSHAISNMTGTSGRQRVPKDSLNLYPVVIPTAEVGDRFGSISKTIIEMMMCNSAQSRTLAELRDTLLPRLVSGELSVPEVEPSLHEVNPC